MGEPDVEAHPAGYRWRRRFPTLSVLGAEGATVYVAQAEGAWWVITHESTMADLLDPDDDADLIATAVELRRFTDRAAWEAEVAAIRERTRPRDDKRGRRLLT